MVIDEQLVHRLARGHQQEGPVGGVLQRPVAPQAEEGLVHQGGRLPGVIGPLPSHPTRGEFSQVLVQQGDQEAFGVGVPRPHPGEETRRVLIRLALRVPGRAGREARRSEILVHRGLRRHLGDAHSVAGHVERIVIENGIFPAPRLICKPSSWIAEQLDERLAVGGQASESSECRHNGPAMTPAPGWAFRPDSDLPGHGSPAPAGSRFTRTFADRHPIENAFHSLSSKIPAKSPNHRRTCDV